MNLEAKITCLATAIALSYASSALADGHSSKGILDGETSSEIVQFFGFLDIDATYINPESGDSTSDLNISNAELGASFFLSDRLTATGSVRYEEDRTDFEVDTAKVVYAFGASGVSVTVGQYYLPFGSSSTAMLSDPLTQEFGEARETALTVDYAQGPFDAGLYIFNGDQDDDGVDQLTNYGARMAYTSNGFSFGIDHISNIADSDTLQGLNYGYSLGAEVISATSIYGEVNVGPLNLMAEAMAASGELAVDGGGSQPKVMNLEASYELQDHIFAFAYQTSEESLFLELPEQRTSLAYRTTMFEGFELGIELAQDNDYSVADGGSGDSTQSILMRISVPLP